MHPTVKQARIAGWLYLLGGAPAPFALIYLPNKLIVPGDATATAGNMGELWIMLWLLIKGARVQPLPAPSV